MTPEDKTSLTVLRDAFLKGQYKAEIEKLIRLERQEVIEAGEHKVASARLNELIHVLRRRAELGPLTVAESSEVADLISRFASMAEAALPESLQTIETREVPDYEEIGFSQLCDEHRQARADIAVLLDAVRVLTVQRDAARKGETIIRDAWNLAVVRKEEAEERETAARAEVTANASEYRRESIQQHNAWMNERAKFHETIEKVCKERNLAIVERDLQCKRAVAVERQLAAEQTLCADNAKAAHWLKGELTVARAERDEQRKRAGNALHDAAQRAEELAHAEGLLEAGTKLMREHMQQRDDHKNAAAELRTKLEAAQFCLDASRAEVECLRDEQNTVISETDLGNISLSLDEDNRSTEAKVIRSACSELVRLRKEITELEPRADLLDALEAAGVDNWPGYAVAKESVDHVEEE